MLKTRREDEMGFLDFLVGAVIARHVLDSHDSKLPRDIILADDDDEAQYDDGYPDDYVGDGLDGTDDYLGDGLDGDDEDYDDDPGW